mgnify:CR=1 FL=1
MEQAKERSSKGIEAAKAVVTVLKNELKRNEPLFDVGRRSLHRII